MIIYALLLWTFVNAQFAWAFFLVGFVGTLFISIMAILESYKQLPVAKIFDVVFPYFVIQMTIGRLTWRLFGIYSVITFIIIYYF